MPEAQKIDRAYRTLLKSAKKYMAPGDTKKIRRALDLAIKACYRQFNTDREA